MKLLTVVALFIQFLLFPSCLIFGKGSKGELWLNIRYIECLGTNLPCNCEKAVGTYYSLVLDTNSLSSNRSISLWEFEDNEPDIYSLKKIARSEFVAIIGDNVPSI